MDKMDDILKDVLHSKADMIKGLGDIEVPDYQEFMDKLANDGASRLRVIDFTDVKKRNDKHKGKRTAKKVIAVAACVVVLSLVFSIAASMPTVKAFRFNIVKTLMEIKDGFLSITQSDIDNDAAISDKENDRADAGDIADNAQANLKHKALIPSYIPAGYALKAIEEKPMLGSDYIIKQSYANDRDGQISIMQISSVSGFNANAVADASGKTVKIGNVDVVLLSTGNNSIYAVWYDDNIQYEVTATTSESDVIKMIESMILSDDK
jgi:hypothetical protein